MLYINVTKTDKNNETTFQKFIVPEKKEEFASVLEFYFSKCKKETVKDVLVYSFTTETEKNKYYVSIAIKEMEETTINDVVNFVLS